MKKRMIKYLEKKKAMEFLIALFKKKKKYRCHQSGSLETMYDVVQIR